jgi:hypothetical protein
MTQPTGAFWQITSLQSEGSNRSRYVYISEDANGGFKLKDLQTSTETTGRKQADGTVVCPEDSGYQSRSHGGKPSYSALLSRGVGPGRGGWWFLLRRPTACYAAGSRDLEAI